MYTGIHVKYPLILSYFNETCSFSIKFRKILKYQISSNPFSADGQTDWRTDMMDLIVAFRKSSKHPKTVNLNVINVTKHFKYISVNRVGQDLWEY